MMRLLIVAVTLLASADGLRVWTAHGTRAQTVRASSFMPVMAHRIRRDVPVEEQKNPQATIEIEEETVEAVKEALKEPLEEAKKLEEAAKEITAPPVQEPKDALDSYLSGEWREIYSTALKARDAAQQGREAATAMKADADAELSETCRLAEAACEAAKQAAKVAHSEALSIAAKAEKAAMAAMAAAETGMADALNLAAQTEEEAKKAAAERQAKAEAALQ